MSSLVREEVALGDTHWQSLRYFSLYRLLLALLLFFAALDPASFTLLQSASPISLFGLTGFYLLATLVAVVLVHRYRSGFSVQLSVQVLVDILVLALLMHAGGGVRSGLGALVLVTLAGAGLVGEGRMALFYAALATLAVLLEQSYQALTTEFAAADFFQTGIFCTGFFAVAISAHMLARRVVANEALARQSAVSLQNQRRVSQRVIEEMQDGVLHLSAEGEVRQHNPRARTLLGLGEQPGGALADYSAALARGFSVWREQAGSDSILLRAGRGQLRARFVETGTPSRDALVFLEDMGEMLARAQQLKLAAVGRLTANIAHEIRNPLSAISHAGELLQEESRRDLQERLLRIICDNTRRIERIVQDVLELGRRDRAVLETVELRELLPFFVEEFRVKEEIPPELVSLEIEGPALLCFDRAHLLQVLWNLVGNALRHSQHQPASLRLRVSQRSPGGLVELDVIDDGPGVAEALRDQVFEPFFTTHNAGTGLGLHIARELCEASGAHLDLLDNSPGAHFRITGRSEGCR